MYIYIYISEFKLGKMMECVEVADWQLLHLEDVDYIFEDVL